MCTGETTADTPPRTIILKLVIEYVMLIKYVDIVVLNVQLVDMESYVK